MVIFKCLLLNFQGYRHQFCLQLSYWFHLFYSQWPNSAKGEQTLSLTFCRCADLLTFFLTKSTVWLVCISLYVLKTRSIRVPLWNIHDTISPLLHFTDLTWTRFLFFFCQRLILIQSRSIMTCQHVRLGISTVFFQKKHFSNMVCRPNVEEWD